METRVKGPKPCRYETIYGLASVWATLYLLKKELKLERLPYKEPEKKEFRDTEGQYSRSTGGDSEAMSIWVAEESRGEISI